MIGFEWSWVLCWIIYIIINDLRGYWLKWKICGRKNKINRAIKNEL
jgi:hypothetical protein